MAKLKTFKYLLTIEVADDIAKKYPNYSINWDTPKEFVEDTVISMTSAADYDLTQKDSLKELGYRIQAKEVKENPRKLSRKSDIVDLEISVRLIKVLRWADIHTIEDLEKITWRQFPKFRNLGPSLLRELKRTAARWHLKIKD